MSFSCRSRVLWRRVKVPSLGDVAAVAGVLGALRAVFPIARFPLEGGGHADGVEELGELPGDEVAAISPVVLKVKGTTRVPSGADSSRT